MKEWIKWLIPAALAIALVIGVGVASHEDPIIPNKPTPTHGTEPTQTEAPPQPAPNFTVLDQDGNPVQLSDYFGKPIVLNFWATWCQYCTQEMPEFQAAYEKYPDVQFLMVNATDGVRETKETASAYIAESGYRFPVFYDVDTAAVTAYGITSFPTTFFIDKEGNLTAYANSALTQEKLEKGISMIRLGA